MGSIFTKANPPVIEAISATQSVITLSFKDGGGGSPHTDSYTVNVYKIATFGNPLIVSMDVTSPAVITGLDPYQLYHVHLYGYSELWQYTATPGTAVITTLPLTGSPPTIKTVTQYTDKLEVYFDKSVTGAPNASKYIVNYYDIKSPASKHSQDVTDSPFSLTGLTPDTTYQIYMYAYNVLWPSTLPTPHYSSGIGTQARTLIVIPATKSFMNNYNSIITVFSQSPKLTDTDISTNQVPTTYFTSTNTSDLPDKLDITKLSLYMFGTRTQVGFQINNVDLGNFFQQDMFQRSVKINVSDELNKAWDKWRVDPNNDRFDTVADYIWYKSDSNEVRSPLLWFYYTIFYDNTVSVDTTLYCLADDFTKIYINGEFVSSEGGKFPYVQIKPGLNYIRVFAYNSGGPGGFKLTIINNNYPNELLAATSTDWAWSYSTSSYHTVRNDLAYGSNDPESGAAPFIGNV